MKRISFLLAAAVVLGAGAARADMDFSALDDQGAPKAHHGHHGACIHKAWAAAKPTEGQTAKAKMYLGDSKKAVEGQKEALKAAFTDMKAAWGAYPIDRNAVMTAETEVQAAIAPVKAAMRDTGINILNLLSKDQRAAFDTELMACHKQHKRHPHN